MLFFKAGLFVALPSDAEGISFAGLGIMPLQLLNLGVILPRLFFRLLLTRTPRGKDYMDLFSLYG
jgi:hypothetical protein